MPKKYNGTYKELQRIVEDAGIDGYWSAVHSGKTLSKYIFKLKDGGIINSWPKGGTVQTQGKADAKEALDAALAPFLSTEDASASK